MILENPAALLVVRGSFSPISKGILQFDMWGIEPSERYDWNKLRENIKKYGIRNSLLVAPMPTASTSQTQGSSLFSTVNEIPPPSCVDPAEADLGLNF